MKWFCHSLLAFLNIRSCFEEVDAGGIESEVVVAFPAEEFAGFSVVNAPCLIKRSFRIVSSRYRAS